MTFRPLSISGVWQITPEIIPDERGCFVRAFSAREMDERELVTCFPITNMGWNRRAGTLRGLHFRNSTRPEVKLLHCSRGCVQDVLLDVRPFSPTYLKHVSVELSAENRISLYVPHGVAHGYLTFEDETEMVYQMSDIHLPEADAGVRWNDPSFGIEWMAPIRVISDRDRTYRDYQVQT